MLYQNSFLSSLYDAERAIVGVCVFEDPTPEQVTAQLRALHPHVGVGVCNARHPADWPAAEDAENDDGKRAVARISHQRV